MFIRTEFITKYIPNINQIIIYEQGILYFFLINFRTHKILEKKPLTSKTKMKRPGYNKVQNVMTVTVT